MISDFHLYSHALHFMYTLIHYSESAVSAVGKFEYLLSMDVHVLQKVHNVSKKSNSRPSAALMTIKNVSLMVCTGFGKSIEYTVFAITK